MLPITIQIPEDDPRPAVDLLFHHLDLAEAIFNALTEVDEWEEHLEWRMAQRRTQFVTDLAFIWIGAAQLAIADED